MKNKDWNVMLAQDLKELADVVLTSNDRVEVKVSVEADKDWFAAVVSDFIPDAKVSKSDRGYGRKKIDGRLEITVMRGQA